MELLDYIRKSNAAGNLQDLSDCFLLFAKDLGFDYFKFSDLSPSSVTGKNNRIALLTNYPPAWLRRYRTGRYVLDDPIYLAAYQTHLPFSWTDILNRQSLNSKSRKILSEAGKYGLVSGISVPVYCSAGGIYEVNFVSSQAMIRDTRNTRSFCNAAAHQLFYAYMSITAAAQVPKWINLTVREKEILHWIAAGKTKSETAEILTVSESCIKRHCENIFVKLEVNNLPAAVAKAAVQGMLNL
jgi:DNA-binding CsgD family transcriptional regulator